MAFAILNPKEARPVRGVLFDMDGLVLDTETLYCRFWQEAANNLGFPMTHQQALGMRALNAQASDALLKSYFGPTVSYGPVRQERIRLMDAYIEKHGVEAKPGIRELLLFLEQQGIPKALATSSPMDRVRNHLGPLGLLNRFDALCSGYEVPHGKPEPDIFLHAAGKLNLNPKDCLVLEDSPAGLLSARRAGCLPVVIPDQDQPDEKTLSLCFAKADSLLDIIDLLQAL